MNFASLHLTARRTQGSAFTVVIPATLLAVAIAGWWWSVQMADEMAGGATGATGMHGAMSFGAFVLAWAAMMAAMMLPSVLPVVRLFARAAAHRRAAPVGFFVAGYLVVWMATALPGFLAWRALEMPIAEGAGWAGRLAGGALIAAALWQLTPLKAACLRHCRSPLGLFLRAGARVTRPSGAVRLGLTHGLFCLGCCWALFAVLVAMGTMNPLWMALLTGLIVIEKSAPRGEQVARAGALAFAGLGSVLIVEPSMLAHLT